MRISPTVSAALLLVCTLPLSMAQDAAPSPSAPAAPQRSEQLFGAEGFAVSAPEGWTIHPGRRTEEGFRIEMTHDMAGGQVGMSVTSNVVPAGSTAAALLEAAVAKLNGRAEYRAHQIRPNRTMAGEPATALDVTWEVATLGNFLIRQHFIVKGERALLVQAYAAVDDHETHQATFDEIADTLRFIEPTAEDESAENVRALAERCGTEAEWATSWIEAQRRAKETGRHVLVVMRAYSGFDLPDSTKFGTFMDEDVLAMIRTRLVPLRLSPTDPSPLQDRAIYGLSPTVLGVAAILMSADGKVLADTPHAEALPLWNWLRQELERTPESARPKAPSDPLLATRHALDRGELQRAAELLLGMEGAPADVERGRLALFQLDGQGALAAWDRAIAADPGLAPELACRRARIHILDGDLALARRTLAPLISDRSSPHHEEAMLSISLLVQQELGANAAVPLWRALTRRSPESRWSWIAAAYLQYLPLIEAVDSDYDVKWPKADVLDIMTEPPRAPARVAETGRVEKEALDWLVSHQREDGSWPGPTELALGVGQPINPITTAVDALCVQALLQRGPDYHERAERGLAFLLAQDALRRESPQPVVYMDFTSWAAWAQLDAIGDALEADVGNADGLRGLASRIVDDVAERVRSGGGWSYYLSGDSSGENPVEQSISFTTAAVILGMQRAAAYGVDIPEPLMTNALDCLYGMRDSDGLFAYMVFHPAGNMTRNPPAGAAGRGPACELALLGGGRSQPDDLRRSLRQFHTHSASLAAEVGKALMHAGPETQGCHYPMFDYLMAARAAVRLSPEDAAMERARILELVLETRLEDGSFLDTPILGPTYGTAAALLTIGALKPE